jgi:hypothetical protein
MDYLVKLYELPPVEPELRKLAAAGIKIKRAIAPEKHLILEWVSAHFGARWASECEASFTQQPIACFVAIKEEKMIGFCCYDATCKDYVGPCGIAGRHRNRGIGRTILLRSLHAMAEQGYAYAIFGAAIRNYYERKFGAIPIPGSEKGIYKDMLKKGK